ncbi:MULTISPECIES: hypothetical protein [Pseudomonas]|uniref:hypothetical protein n=1 Tax=Pseudomonas TaxID=286 RepID=UPI00156DF4C9|nr:MULTISPECIES: hypothetical protein [Pseudomonas]
MPAAWEILLNATNTNAAKEHKPILYEYFIDKPSQKIQPPNNYRAAPHKKIHYQGKQHQQHHLKFKEMKP